MLLLINFVISILNMDKTSDTVVRLYKNRIITYQMAPCFMVTA